MKKKIVSKTLAILLAGGALVGVTSCDKISGIIPTETPSNTTGGVVTPTPTPNPTPNPTTPVTPTPNPTPTPTPTQRFMLRLN